MAKSIKPRRQKSTVKYRTLVWSPPLRGVGPPIDSFGYILLISLRRLRNNWPTFAWLLLIFLIGAGFLFWGFDPSLDLASRQAQLEIIHGTSWAGRLSIATSQLQYLSQQLLANTDFNFYFGIWLIGLSLTLTSTSRRLRRQPPKSWRVAGRTALDGLYFGPAQLVPFCLVLAFLLGQLMPALIANAVATDLRAGGLLASNAAQLIALSVVGLITWLSLYLVAGSVFGLIVASRPGVRPAAAWQTSWDLTTHRRPQVAAYLLGGGLVGLLATGLIMIPVLWFALGVAALVFNGWLILLAFWWHLYFFELYQSLIKPQTKK